ncbi:hypothetical protein OKW29_001747 [Paraburkholderia sp. CI3]
MTRDVGPKRECDVLWEAHLFDGFFVESDDLIARDSLAELACRYVLHRENVARAASHELHAFPRKITDGTLLWWQDGACREYPQAQQVSQVARVGLIATVLEPIVFLDRGGVGQMHHKAGGLQAVDKPVPVIRRFDYDASQLGLPRGKERQDPGQIVRQPLLGDPRGPFRRSRSPRCCSNAGQCRYSS